MDKVIKDEPWNLVTQELLPCLHFTEQYNCKWRVLLSLLSSALLGGTINSPFGNLNYSKFSFNITDRFLETATLSKTISNKQDLWTFCSALVRMWIYIINIMANDNWMKIWSDWYWAALVLSPVQSRKGWEETELPYRIVSSRWSLFISVCRLSPDGPHSRIRFQSKKPLLYLPKLENYWDTSVFTTNNPYLAALFTYDSNIILIPINQYIYSLILWHHHKLPSEDF